MSYYLYQLSFDTPVHFGAAELGGTLEQIGVNFPADTLFSALCSEMATSGAEDAIKSLYEKAQAGEILFSDLFPYEENAGDMFFYIPKPVLPIRYHEMITPASYEEACVASRQKKKRKNMQYIRASRLDEYLAALENGQYFSDDVDFGQDVLVEKVNCRGQETNAEPLPYYVGAYAFRDNVGLYGIVKAPAEDIVWIEDALTLLGYAGIGGKRSSGYGKFQLLDTPLIMDDDDTYVDEVCIYRRLTVTESSWYMNISGLIPNRIEIDSVKQGWYTLRKRSGFVAGTKNHRAAKRNTVYMISSGSCFKTKMNGSIIDLATGDNLRTVYRYGKGLYLGLRP